MRSRAVPPITPLAPYYALCAWSALNQCVSSDLGVSGVFLCVIELTFGRWNTVLREKFNLRALWTLTISLTHKDI